MITKQQAMTESIFHFGDCTTRPLARNSNIVRTVVCRRNGATKTWKTRPNDFRVPIKHGLYEYGQIIHVEGGKGNADQFHTEERCPLDAEWTAVVSKIGLEPPAVTVVKFLKMIKITANETNPRDISTQMGISLAEAEQVYEALKTAPEQTED